MHRNKVFKIPHSSSKDEILVYVPSLMKWGVVSEEESDNLPEYILTDDYVSTEDEDFPFPPIFDSLTLHLSGACNMSCSYCFNSQGAHSTALSRAQMKNAIDYLYTHPRGKKLKVHFNGGEPTVAWDALRYAVDYARSAKSHYDVEADLCITSNGIWSSSQYDYIVDNFNDITISIDGPEEVHDANRKLKSGGGTHNIVYRIAKALCDVESLNLCLSVTMARRFVSRMTDTMRYLCEEFPTADIFIEALRADNQSDHTRDDLYPDVAAFLSSYINSIADIRAAGYTNDISNSFIKPSCDSCTRYCGASGRNFIVSPGGTITSCGAMTYSRSRASEYFTFGEIRDDGIRFNEDKYRRLVTWDVNAIEKCHGCIAHNYCRGGCLSKKAHMDSFWSRPSVHCEEIQAVMPEYLWCQYEELSGRKRKS